MASNSGQDGLIAKLDEMDERFSDITERMNDPAVASNPTKIIALAKEHAQMGRIISPYRRYKKLASDLAEAQSILDDPQSDPEMRTLAHAEIEDVTSTAEDAIGEVRSILVTAGDDEINSIILEIRAGTGGQEASLFAGNLLNMYRHYAEQKKWKFEVLSANATEMGGFREIIVNVSGNGVWSRLGYEGGGHRVQRVPKTEAQGRIHTSAATVAVLPEPEDVQVDINWEKDVNEYTSRASGPGGQNVNKVESAIRLEHKETGITVSMRDEKSQHKNRAKARRILATRVYEYHRNKQAAVEAAARKEMIGSGDRSQRIRTYNFPQNRCTDHRLKTGPAQEANYNLDKIIVGQLDELIDALSAKDRAERLAKL